MYMWTNRGCFVSLQGSLYGERTCQWLISIVCLSNLCGVRSSVLQTSLHTWKRWVLNSVVAHICLQAVLLTKTRDQLVHRQDVEDRGADLGEAEDGQVSTSAVCCAKSTRQHQKPADSSATVLFGKFDPPLFSVCIFGRELPYRSPAHLLAEISLKSLNDTCMELLAPMRGMSEYPWGILVDIPVPPRFRARWFDVGVPQIRLHLSTQKFRTRHEPGKEEPSRSSCGGIPGLEAISSPEVCFDCRVPTLSRLRSGVAGSLRRTSHSKSNTSVSTSSYFLEVVGMTPS